MSSDIFMALVPAGDAQSRIEEAVQEVNGLVTPDRKPKMDVERVRKINTAR